MGNCPSNPAERLYHAVEQNDVNAVRRLHQQGAPLEFRDAKGRTPLMVASYNPCGFEMTRTLITLNANVNAFRPGPDGGYPLHHAAKKGLDRVAYLLVCAGANPLAVNEDGKSAIDVARAKGFAAVVRVLENYIAPFHGSMREQSYSAPGFIEIIAAGFLQKSCFVVILPRELDPLRPPRHELLVYPSQADCKPRHVLQLQHAVIDMQKTQTSDPVLIVTGTSGANQKSRVRLLGSPEGPAGRAQLQHLHDVCAGIANPRPTQPPASGVPAGRPPHPPMQMLSQFPTPAPAPTLTPGPVPQPQPTGGNAGAGLPPLSSKPGTTPEAVQSEDEALARAIAASLETAWQEGVPLSPPPAEGPSSSSAPRSNRPVPSSGSPRQGSSALSDLYRGWGDAPTASSYAGWAPSPAVTRPASGGGARAGSSDQAGGMPPVSSSAPPGRTPPARPAGEGGRSGGGAAASEAPGGAPSALPPSAPPLPPNYTLGESMIVPPGGVGGSGSSKDASCPICMDSPAGAVCVPCGHVAGCLSCLTVVKSQGNGCPVCRAGIREVIRVYMSS